MMKCVFSLVVLLYLCNTLAIDYNLNNEIIHSLKKLTKLYEEHQINFSSPEKVKVPSMKMCKHSAVCVDVFKKELQTLLSDQVQVHNDSNSNTADTLEALEGNLELLQQTENKTGYHCNMTHSHDLLKVFNQYIHFLEKLNGNSTTQ